VSWVSGLWSLLGGRRPAPFNPGDQLVCGGETWTVSAVLTEQGGGREWPTLGLTRGTQTVWITIDGDDVVRYAPLPDAQLGDDERVTWNGRTYTVSERGSYTVTGVAGDTEASVGDRASYLTLTNAQDTEHSLSVERWEGGSTDVSVASAWRIDRIMRPGQS
jgi:hypothetical protein